MSFEACLDDAEPVDWEGWMHECLEVQRSVWWPADTPCQFCGLRIERVADD